jgi:hypothetical protein
MTGGWIWAVQHGAEGGGRARVGALRASRGGQQWLGGVLAGFSVAARGIGRRCHYVRGSSDTGWWALVQTGARAAPGDTGYQRRDPAAESFVVPGAAVEGVRASHRGHREELLDESRDHRGALSQRLLDHILDVPEGGLGADRDRLPGILPRSRRPPLGEHLEPRARRCPVLNGHDPSGHGLGTLAQEAQSKMICAAVPSTRQEESP